MINVRQGTFETNSSSTHSLIISEKGEANYLPLAKHIKIEWIDTNDYYVLDSLTEKISYLVSQVANKLKYACNTYEELLEEIEENYEYRQLTDYIKEKFDKEIRFPANKNGIYDDVECIAEINHQLVPWGSGAVIEETLTDLVEYRENRDGERLKPEDEVLSFEEKLDLYLDNGNFISFGRD